MQIKLCSSEECTNNAQTGGVCIKHGAKVKMSNAAMVDQRRMEHASMPTGANHMNVIYRYPSQQQTHIHHHHYQQQMMMHQQQQMAQMHRNHMQQQQQPPLVGYQRQQQQQVVIQQQKGKPNKPSESPIIKTGMVAQTTHQNDLAALSYHELVKKANEATSTKEMHKKSSSDNSTSSRKTPAVATSDCTTASASSDKRNIHSNRKRKSSPADEELAGERARRNGNKLCSADGCVKFAQTEGVCVRHGAKVKTKTCSSDGCTNIVKNGGVCIKHGAKVKLCSSEGCTNKIVKGGVCIKHEAKRKLCSSEGCTIMQRKEECASGMVQRKRLESYVALKDGQILPSKEECVGVIDHQDTRQTWRS